MLTNSIGVWEKSASINLLSLALWSSSRYNFAFIFIFSISRRRLEDSSKVTELFVQPEDPANLHSDFHRELSKAGERSVGEFDEEERVWHADIHDKECAQHDLWLVYKLVLFPRTNPALPFVSHAWRNLIRPGHQKRLGNDERWRLPCAWKVSFRSIGKQLVEHKSLNTNSRKLPKTRKHCVKAFIEEACCCFLQKLNAFLF